VSLEIDAKPQCHPGQRLGDESIMGAIGFLTPSWVIRDGGHEIGTGCAQSEHGEAEKNQIGYQIDRWTRAAVRRMLRNLRVPNETECQSGEASKSRTASDS